MTDENKRSGPQGSGSALAGGGSEGTAPPPWGQITATTVAGCFLVWLGGGSGFWANVAFWPGLGALLVGLNDARRRRQAEHDRRVRAGVARPRSPLASGVALSVLGLAMTAGSFTLIRTFAATAADPKAAAEPLVYTMVAGVVLAAVGIFRLFSA